MKCVQCHDRVVHGDLGSAHNGMRMQACLRCHGLDASAKAPGTCSTCHPPSFKLKPDSHDSYGWLNPFKGRRAEHSEEAQRDRKVCQTCHLESFCSSCHGLKMPHRTTNWVSGAKEHVKLQSERPELCAKCHRESNFCGACHHGYNEALDGPWISIHPQMAKQSGVVGCFACHGPAYCPYCHVTGVKPKSIKGP